METLKELLALAGFGPEYIQALLWISLASVFVPQIIKRSVPRIHPELLSVLAGAGSAVAFLPDTAKAVMLGIIVASFWTVAYKPVMRLVYKRWPDLEEKLSAAPTKKAVQTPSGVEVRDITVPSGADEKTLFIGAPTEAPDTTVPKEGTTVPQKGTGSD